MTSSWQNIPLKDLLTKSDNWIELRPDDLYREITVRLWGKGVVQRGEVTGMDVASKQKNKVKSGQLILSRIDARHGAFGIVPLNLDGAVVSGDFPVFNVNAARVEPHFLEWMTKTKDFIEICKKASEGTTNRVRLKEEKFLEMVVAIPSLPEQRKIVAQIENISQKLSEAHKLQEVTQKEIDALIDSELKRIFGKASGWKSGVMPDFVTVNPTRAQADFKAAETVSFVPMSAVDEVSGTIKEKISKPFYQVSKGYTYFEDGDVIFAKITPCMQNGKSAIAENLENGIGFGSTEFHVLRPGPEIKAEWLHLLVRSKEFRKDAATHFKGTAGQQRAPNSFLKNKVITVPSLPEQDRLIKYFKYFKEKLSQLGQIQIKLDKEIQSLMPSVLDKAFKGELYKARKI